MRELYYLTDDPNEETNLARDSARAATMNAIADELWRFQRTELNESASVLFPHNTQEPTFNAQFKK